MFRPKESHPMYTSSSTSYSTEKVDPNEWVNDLEKNSNKSEDAKSNSDAIKVDVNESGSVLSEGAATKFNPEDVNAILIEHDEEVYGGTLRMWFLAIALSAVVGGVDSFFVMRFPSIHINTIVIQVLSWPLGQFWYYAVPKWRIPFPRGYGLELNPGPFNYKEHTCIFMFANVITSANLINNMFIEDVKFFHANSTIGRQILFNCSCYLIALGAVGLTKSILVNPADRIWPGVLSNIALFKTIYSRDNPVANGWKISRSAFFVIVFGCSFVYYWFPDLIFPFFSTIGAWISWIKPNNASLSQVFGVKSGLGLFPLTLDWTQISSINNPLTTPFWAVGMMFFSFVFWIWIIMPALYYTNRWETAHFPIMSNAVFDKHGKPYKFAKVVNSDWSLNTKKFLNYSPALLPVSFLMSLALGIASFAAVVVHFALMFRDEVIKPWKKRNKRSKTADTDVFNLAIHRYGEFPLWVSAIPIVVGLGLGFAFCEGWSDAPIRADGFIVSIIIGLILYVPLSLVESRANTLISVDSFFELISAFWFKGEGLKVLYFYTFGYATLQHGMHMSQSAKVGHYLQIPPKLTMTVLLCGGIWASLVNPAVTGYILNHIDDICSLKAKNNMNCRKQRTAFNKQVFWGLFGAEVFKPGGRYSFVLWFFLVGAVVALVHFAALKYFKKPWLKRFDPVLFFAGAANVPGVTGFNFSTWFVTALIFNFAIHRRYTAWWRKYNLVTSVGLDVGVAIAVIIIYFAVVYTGGSAHYKWWATEVAGKGCDSKGCPHLTGPLPKLKGY